jgi:hypothetical protein
MASRRGSYGLRSVNRRLLTATLPSASRARIVALTRTRPSRSTSACFRRESLTFAVDGRPSGSSIGADPTLTPRRLVASLTLPEHGPDSSDARHLR